MDKISIVTISYNQGQFLEECILSVISQGYENLEYIVVDPGSSDGSRDIIEKYRDQISVVILDKDKGPADGLNKGFEKATGDIFGYINADDRLVENSLNFVSKYFKLNQKTDVVCGAINIINESGQKSFRKRCSDKFNLADYATGISAIAQQASFFRKTAFEKTNGFNIQNNVAWDGELWVDMALEGCQFKTVDKILGDFRIYDQSITGSGQFHKDQLKNLEYLKQKIKNSNVRVYSGVEQRFRRLLYKINLLRHVRYYIVQ